LLLCVWPGVLVFGNVVFGIILRCENFVIYGWSIEMCLDRILRDSGGVVLERSSVAVRN
jgi:hypothetical protein